VYILLLFISGRLNSHTNYYQIQIGTEDVKLVTFTLDGRKIILIDTPGFDDTKRTDIDILEIIGLHLQEGSKKKMFLTGVIYMQRITDNRMPGSATRSLRVLRKLCGVDNYHHLALVTSHWDIVSHDEGVYRENQLRNGDEYWKEMLDNGAIVDRHLNNKESAIKILKHFLPKPSIVLQYQKEFGEHGIVGKTAAGMVILDSLHEELEMHKKRLEQLIKENAAVKAKNAELESRVDLLQAKVDRLREDERKRERGIEENLLSKAQIVRDSETKQREMEGEMRALREQVLKLNLDQENLVNEHMKSKETLLDEAITAKNEAERKMQDLTRELEKLRQDDKGDGVTNDDSSSNQQTVGKVKIETGGDQDIAKSTVNEDLISTEQAVRESETEKNTAETQINSLKDEIEKLKQDLENERAEKERILYEKLKSKEEAIKEVKTAKINAENEIGLLTTRLESPQHDKEGRRIEKDLRLTEQAIETAEIAKGVAEREMEGVEKDMNKVQSEQQRATEEISMLQTPVKEIVSEKRWLRLPECVNQ
jgi:chromosome segregation ATPase